MQAGTPPTPQSPAELCVRFPCPGCQDLLFIPVEQLSRQRADRCPKCHSPIEFPLIDERLKGYAQVVASSKPSLNVACPICAKPLEVHEEPPGAVRKCPSCTTALRLELLPVHAESAQSTPPGPIGDQETGHSPASGRGPVISPPETEPPEGPSAPPSVPPSSGPPADPCGPASSPGTKQSQTPPSASSFAVVTTAANPKKRSRNPPRKAGLDAAIIQIGPPPLIYAGQIALAHPGSFLFDISMSPRLVWWTTYLLVKLGPMAYCIAVLIKTFGSIDVLVTVPLGILAWTWLVWGVLPCRWAADFVCSIVISAFVCPGCGEEYEPISRWGCGCGYVDHRERHLLWFHCPKCKGVLGYLDCAHCGSTLIVR